MNIQEIKAKYLFDSTGAFGGEKNPIKKHQMRENLKKKNNAELEKVVNEHERIRDLVSQARKIFSFGRSWKQGPAINKAYEDAVRAIDRLWAVVSMRGKNLENLNKK